MHSNASQQNLPPLIRALCDPAVWPHPVVSVRVIETHISWILLTGQYAYKIKQPLNLGFLDFSTLAQRRTACHDELKLNRRFAPELYESVVAISGSESAPVISDDPPGAHPDTAAALEYAVRMREFPQNNQLDRQLLSGDLELTDMDELARCVAEMHAHSTVARPDDAWGTIASIADPAMENFSVLETLVDDTADRITLARLRDWTSQQISRLTPLMDQRRLNGFVRECHGDLHLSNLARIDKQIIPFDCIEFDPALRWRDVMSDVGFLVMDLAARLRVDMAWRFLNRYLEHTGDYNGAALLRFYLVYGSLVRAKISAIRAEQESPRSNAYVDAARHYRMHLALAERAIRPRHPVILLTTGTSGSGKTWLTNRLSFVLPAIRLRSDIERKRLHGISPGQSSKSDLLAGIYSPEATGRTYQYLRDQAQALLASNFDLIIDASFLLQKHRHLFIELAEKTRCDLVILDCHADERVLRERIAQREWDGADASEANQAVLTEQRASAEPLTTDEQALAISIDTTENTDPLRVAGDIWRKLGREILD